MKGIVHIRVDDRLIHGQVATRWVSHFNANRIMVIDDAVAANDVEKMLLRSAAPEGCNTSILSFEKASANILAGNYDGQRVLILLKTPELALKLMNASHTSTRSENNVDFVLGGKSDEDGGGNGGNGGNGGSGGNTPGGDDGDEAPDPTV